MDTRIRKQARALRELVDAVLELMGRAFRAEIDRLQRLAVKAAPMARGMEGMRRLRTTAKTRSSGWKKSRTGTSQKATTRRTQSFIGATHCIEGASHDESGTGWQLC